MQVLGISGSIRTGSWNQALLHAVGLRLELLGATFSEAPLREIPMYDPDLELELGFPKPVADLR